MSTTATSRADALRPKIAFALRIVEVAVSFVMLCTAGHVAAQLGPGWTQYFGGIGLGVFTGLFGTLTAALYLAAPFILKRVDNVHTQRLNKALPGLLDIVVSSWWCILCLAVGAADASGLTAFSVCGRDNGWGGALFPAWRYRRSLLWSSQGVCGAWAITVACGFVLFGAWGTSAVLAGFDLRDGKGLVTLGGRKADGKAPAADAGAQTATGGGDAKTVDNV